MSEERMSIAQAADFLKVTEITMNRYVREKLIQFEEDDNGEVYLLKEAVKRYKRINEQFSKR